MILFENLNPFQRRHPLAMSLKCMNPSFPTPNPRAIRKLSHMLRHKTIKFATLQCLMLCLCYRNRLIVSFSLALIRDIKEPLQMNNIIWSTAKMIVYVRTTECEC